MFKVPEGFRLKTGTMGTTKHDGRNGVFIIKRTSYQIRIIASDGEGWEHVSVSILNRKGISETPSWDIMCEVKNYFWDKEDCVVQFHPPKSEYVNMHPNVLHLWRESGKNFKTPPSIMVGINL